MDEANAASQVVVSAGQVVTWGIGIGSAVVGSVTLQIKNLRGRMDVKLDAIQRDLSRLGERHAKLEGKHDGTVDRVVELSGRLGSLERDCPLRGAGGSKQRTSK